MFVVDRDTSSVSVCFSFTCSYKKIALVCSIMTCAIVNVYMSLSLLCGYWALTSYRAYQRQKADKAELDACLEEASAYEISDCMPLEHEEAFDRSNLLALIGKRKQQARYFANLAFIKFGRLKHSEANMIMVRRWISGIMVKGKEGANGMELHTSLQLYGLSPKDISIIIEDATVLFWIPPLTDLVSGMDTFVHTHL